MKVSKDPKRDTAFDSERRAEFVLAMDISSHKMSMPLYMLFWIVDWLYVPSLAWAFLPLRAAIIPFNLLLKRHLKKISTLRQAEATAMVHSFVNAFLISIMIYIIGDPGTVYYAGLNLVGLGAINFFPWRGSLIPVVFVAVYGPYLVYGSIRALLHRQYLAVFVTNCFFIVGTALLSLVIRKFNEGYRRKEFDSRLDLADELRMREKVIATKTNEALQLRNLSRQFSPQIVHAISSGKMNLNAEVHRANICAIFVDIVNSTQRIVRIDKDSINEVISQFMDDSMRTLIKYDLTIDKFLGDGILAFANDPMTHPDYIERTILAGLDIMERLNQNQSYYEDRWLQKFQVRMGIAAGFANVGFYGKSEIFRTYTAIGPVMNLASRLCSEAKPGSILVSNEIFRGLGQTDLCEFRPVGNVKLKGFEDDLIKAYEVLRSPSSEDCPTVNGTIEECPSCKKIMHLDVDVNGFYVFRCRDCESLVGTNPADKKAS